MWGCQDYNNSIVFCFHMIATEKLRTKCPQIARDLTKFTKREMKKGTIFFLLRDHITARSLYRKDITSERERESVSNIFKVILIVYTDTKIWMYHITPAGYRYRFPNQENRCRNNNNSLSFSSTLHRMVLLLQNMHFLVTLNAKKDSQFLLLFF